MNCLFALRGTVRVVDGVEQYIGGQKKLRNFPNHVKFADIRHTANELWKPEGGPTSLKACMNDCIFEVEDDDDVVAILEEISRNPQVRLKVWIVSQFVEKNKKKKQKSTSKGKRSRAAFDNDETMQSDRADEQSLHTPLACARTPLKGLTPLGSSIGPSSSVNGGRVGGFSPVLPSVGLDDGVYRPVIQECYPPPPLSGNAVSEVPGVSDEWAADLFGPWGFPDEAHLYASSPHRERWHGVHEQGECSYASEDGHASEFVSAPPGDCAVPRHRPPSEDGDDPEAPVPGASSSPGVVPSETRRKGGRCTKKQKGAEYCGSNNRAPGRSKWESDHVIEVNHEDAKRPEYINFRVGQRFQHREALGFACTTYAVYHAFKLKTDHCSRKQFIVRCIGSGEDQCTWRLYATDQGDGDVFRIATLTETHSCYTPGVLAGQKPQANVKWLAQMVEPYVRLNLNCKIDVLHDIFLVTQGMDLGYKTIWNAKEKAIDKVRGSFASAYQKLLDYSDELSKADPDSVKIFHLDDRNAFNRLFWTYGEAVRTYRKYLRRIIVIDATFLGGRSYGTLFSACAVDADRHIFPIGFAIAQGEKEDNWHFFLENLQRHVLVAGEPIIFMSDRHPSILKTVAQLFPHCLHSFCAHHIRGNLGDAKLGEKFMKLSRTLTDQEFNSRMEKIRERSARVHTHINNIGKDHWSELHILLAGWRRYGVTTSNHVESWNSLIKDYRTQPVHVLVQEIRSLCMRRYKTFGDAAKLMSGKVCDTAEWALLDNAMKGGTFQVKPCSDVLFEVMTPEDTHVVDLEAAECSCNAWQALGIPCSHAIKCMTLRGLDPYSSCDPCYSRETLVATYQEIWRPTRDQTQWIQNPMSRKILTPPKKKSAGRPRMKRRRRMIWGKPVQERRCSKCLGTGHNSRTCRAEPQNNDAVDSDF